MRVSPASLPPPPCPSPTPSSPLLPSESTFPSLPLEGPGTGGFVGSCSYTNLRQEAHFQILSKASPRPHSNCLLGLLHTRGQRPEPGEAASLAAGKAGLGLCEQVALVCLSGMQPGEAAISKTTLAPNLGKLGRPTWHPSTHSQDPRLFWKGSQGPSDYGGGAV